MQTWWKDANNSTEEAQRRKLFSRNLLFYIKMHQLIYSPCWILKYSWEQAEPKLWAQNTAPWKHVTNDCVCMCVHLVWGGMGAYFKCLSNTDLNTRHFLSIIRALTRAWINTEGSICENATLMMSCSTNSAALSVSTSQALDTAVWLPGDEQEPPARD